MNEQIMNFLRKPGVVPAGVGVIAFSGGLGLGWFLSNRKWSAAMEEYLGEQDRITEDFEQVIEEKIVKFEREMDEHSTHFNATLKDVQDARDETSIVLNPQRDPRTVKVDYAALSRGDRPYEDEPDEEEELPQLEGSESVTPVTFEAPSEDWDAEEEHAKRTDTQPYVLHKDEFFAEESGYPQQTLTYYAGDDILVDQDEKPIYNPSQVVGEYKFGHGSGDQNVFYVRNDRNRAEYEILYDRGQYAIEVLGHEEEVRESAELRHSTHRPRKFRSDE